MSAADEGVRPAIYGGVWYWENQVALRLKARPTTSVTEIRETTG
jgi:hypothetical protein